MYHKRTLTTVVLLVLALCLIPVPAISQGEVSTLTQYTLLIIAPDNFMEELQPLKRFKDASGRPTILVSLTQIYNAFPGADTAEKVKNGIAHYRSANGIRYVMLVGDIDRFPARWRWWGLPGQEGWGVTDLYYADLYEHGTTTFDDWDANDNGLYAEVEFAPDGMINNDQIDILPDVAVGRVPASTEAEVTAYVNKVIAYELKTLPSSVWFKRAALYTGTWLNANGLKDTLGNALAGKGFTLIKRYTDWTDPAHPQPPAGVPNVIFNDLNSGVGFVNYLGHGNAGCMACLGVCSGNLTNLTNTDKLPVVFAGACDTGMFAWLARPHPYIDTAGATHCGTENGEALNPGPYPHTSLPRPAPLQSGTITCPGPLCTTCQLDHSCFAESILFGNPVGTTGAIAYLGERSGAQPWVFDLDTHLFNAYHAQNMTILGDMWKYMIEQYYNQHNLGQSHTWSRQPADWDIGHMFDEPHKLILFGDPSLIIGGAFTSTVSGTVRDWSGGPWFGYLRYRVTGDVTVPAGATLTVFPYASILVEDRKKITALGTNPSQGLIVNGTSDQPVYFMSLSADPQADHVVHGMKVRGQLRVWNGGQIKLH
ncbi:MAG: C25 family cysteine peptidase [Anaerolineae bacterium]